MLGLVVRVAVVSGRLRLLLPFSVPFAGLLVLWLGKFCHFHDLVNVVDRC